jgi:hypothetical protein
MMQEPVRTSWIWVSLPLGAALLAGVFILSRLNGEPPASSEISIAFTTLFVLAVAAWIVAHREDNATGWILLAGSMSLFITQFITEWAQYTLLTEPGALPFGNAAAWISLWIWVVMIFILYIWLPLLFPTGRPISPGWRRVLGLTGLGLVLLILTFGLKPGPMEELEPARNPLGFDALAPFYPALEVFSTLVFLFLIGLALLSVVARYRHSQGDERAQMKWFLFAVSLLFVNAFRGITTDLFELFPPIPRALEDWIFAGNIILIALSIAVAILKYRLYDIDVIIRRTLIYGTLTSSLALVYFGSILLLQSMVPALIGGNSQIAIVLSTLFIAALFTPLRRRIQTIIDRRFYRRKYDAEKIIASFYTAMQDPVDPDQVAERLLKVVQQTMQPEQVSIWISGKR